MRICTICTSTNDGLIPVLIYVRVPVVRCVFAFSRPFLFYAFIFYRYYNYLLLLIFRGGILGENLIRINRRENSDRGAIDVAGIPAGKSALSPAQDRRDRAGWTDGRRSRQGPMTGWSWTPAAFRGSFAVPRGAIYYRGSSRRGQSRFSPRPERGRKPGTGGGGAGGGRGRG